jgi:hypothetical protein
MTGYRWRCVGGGLERKALCFLRMFRFVRKRCLAENLSVSTLTTILVSGQDEASFVGKCLYIKHLVSFRTHSVRVYDLVDLAHQAGSHCTPLDQIHLACRSCGQMRSALVVEEAVTTCSCSFFAVVGVASGNQNQQAADVDEDGRWVACGL